MSNKSRLGGNRDDDDKDDDEERPSSPAKSPFGSRPNDPPKPSPFSSASKPGSPFSSSGTGSGSSGGSGGSGSGPGGPPKPNPFSSASKPGDPPKTGGSGGSPSSPFGNRPNDPPKPGSPSSNPPNRPADPPKPGSPFNNPASRPSEPPKPGSPFGNPANKPADPPKTPPSKPGGIFGSRPDDPARSTGSSPKLDPPKPDDKKDDKKDDKGGDKPAGIGGVFNRFGGGNKPDDKKDDKPATPKFGSPAKPDDKKDDKGGDKPAGIGGVFNRFGGGNKPDDKKDDKKSDKPAVPPPPKVGGASATPAKPDDKNAGAKPGGALGGVFNRLGGGAAAPAKPDEKNAGNAPAKPIGSAPSSAPKIGAAPSSTAKPDASKKPDDKASAEKPGGFFGRFGRGGNAPAEPAKPATGAPALKSAGPATAGDPKKTTGTASKVPPARGDKQAKPLERASTQVAVRNNGLSLDQKLDLVGYALIISSLIMFGGLFHPGDGSITSTVNKMLGQLFGWGRVVWPFIFIGIGGWLLVRHFKENPFLEVNYMRLIGWAFLFLTLVTTLQFAELLQKPVRDMAELTKVSAAAVNDLSGGGWVGDKLYMLLISIAGQWGIAILLIGFWVIAGMIALEIELARLALYGKSMFRYVARMRRAGIERGQIRKQERAAALAAKGDQVTIEKPVKGAPALAASTAGSPGAAALPEPASSGKVPRLTASNPTTNGGTTPPAVAPADGGTAGTNTPVVPSAPPLSGARPAAPAASTASAPAASRTGVFGRVGGAPTAEKPAGQTDEKKDDKAAVPAALTPSRPTPLGVAPVAQADSATPATANDAKTPSSKPGGLFGRSPFGGNKAADKPDATATGTAPAATVTDKAVESNGTPKADSAPKRNGIFGSVFGSRTSGADAKKDDVKDTNNSAASDVAKTNGTNGSNGSATPATATTVNTGTTTSPAAPAKPSGVFARATDPNAAAATNKVETPAKPAEQSKPNDVANTTSTAPKTDSGSFSTRSAPLTPALEDSKPAAAVAPKPGIFGAKPASPADASNGKDANGSTDNKISVASTADPKLAPPVSKPNIFGSGAPAKPAASPLGAKPTPASNPDDDLEDDADQKPADVKPASPISKPGIFGATTPASSPKVEVKSSSGIFGAKPASAPSKDVDEKDDLPEDDEPLDEADLKPAAPKGLPISSAPATPAKPSIFAGGSSAAPKPTSGIFGAKPNTDSSKDPGKDVQSSDDLDEPDEAIDELDGADLKPAAPKGLTPKPSIFGSSPTAKPAANPFGAKPLTPSTPAEPATTASKPNLLGSAPAASGSGIGGARPAPKPGIASQPGNRPSLPVKGNSALDDDPLDDEPEEKIAYEPIDDADVPVDEVDEVKDVAPAKPAVPPPPARSPFGSTPPRPGGSPFGPKPGNTPTVKIGEDASEEKAPEKLPTKTEILKPEQPTAVPAASISSTPAPTMSSTPPATPTAATAVPKPAMTPAPTKPEPVSTPYSSPARSRGNYGWDMPDVQTLLDTKSSQNIQDEVLKERSALIEETLASFGAPGKVVEINSGPTITQFGVEPDYLVSKQGKKTRVKVSAIAKLDADLALALAARSIRIEAPVPGKGYVGIEVPNAETALVGLRDIMNAPEFQKINSKLRIALGRSVDGAPVVADLTSMPHMLIAGTTGSGKSVCVNAIIACMLLQNSPDDLKLIMVDPKRVELTGYNGIPHLVSPVVVDLERIVGVLKWVTREMDERYKKFSAAGARNLIDYNSRIGPMDPKLPYLVVVIDELADLMMLAPEETEKVLTRLAQMARATGIHLILSTQRPSVDVVTGLIKANFPSRISFAVASSVDSRVILDQPGAEKLLGKGDMLYQAPDAAAPMRVQGVYVSDAEINRITKHWKEAKFEQGDTKAAPAITATSFNPTEKPAEPIQSRSDRFGGPARPSFGGSSSSGGSGNSGSSGQRSSGSNWAPSANRPGGSFSSSSTSTPSSSSSTLSTQSDEGDDDEMYQKALALHKEVGKVSISLLQRRLRIGFTRAEQLIKQMKDRGDLGVE